MFYIKDSITNTIIINKSKFIANIFPVRDIDDCLNKLQDIKTKYFDATHNCYAYIIGDEQNIQKCSDDGEPQKTAGFPILDVLKKRNITNVLAIVTRYFGGTLLGASGLIKAYSSATSLALDKIDLYIKDIFLETNIVLNYKEYNSLIKLDYINILDTNFLTDINIKLEFQSKYKERFEKDIKNICKIDISLNYTTNYSLKKIESDA